MACEICGQKIGKYKVCPECRNPEEDMWICLTCLQVKPADQFYKKNGKLCIYCKSCEKEKKDIDSGKNGKYRLLSKKEAFRHLAIGVLDLTMQDYQRKPNNIETCKDKRMKIWYMLLDTYLTQDCVYLFNWCKVVNMTVKSYLKTVKGGVK